MSAIKTDPEIMHGVPCFAGTRVPIYVLFDWLWGGETIGDFLEQYPSLTLAQVRQVLDEARWTVAPDPRWLIEANRRDEQKATASPAAGAA